MNTNKGNTTLIIILVVLLLLGFWWYNSGRYAKLENPVDLTATTYNYDTWNNRSNWDNNRNQAYNSRAMMPRGSATGYAYVTYPIDRASSSSAYSTPASYSQTYQQSGYYYGDMANPCPCDFGYSGY